MTKHVKWLRGGSTGIDGGVLPLRNHRLFLGVAQRLLCLHYRRIYTSAPRISLLTRPVQTKGTMRHPEGGGGRERTAHHALAALSHSHQRTTYQSRKFPIKHRRGRERERMEYHARNHQADTGEERIL